MKSNETFSVRCAGREDVHKLAALIEDAYRGGRASVAWKNEHDLVQGPRTSVQELINIVESADSVILMLESNGVLAGSVMVENHQTNGHIGMLAVNPDFQNRGIGGRLLQLAELYAQQKFGKSEFVMWVLSDRTELLQWYCSKGYALTGETAPFPCTEETGLVPRNKDVHFLVIRKLLSQPSLLAENAASNFGVTGSLFVALCL